MNKRLTLILAIIILAVMSVSIVAAVNETSDSLAADDSQDDAISEDGDDIKPVVNDGDDVKQAGTFTIKKVWNDNDDKQGKRPKSVSVSVIINEDPRGEFVLNEENGWQTTITDVDEGSSVEIKEEAVDGYTTNVTGSVEEGYTITNTLEDQDQNATDPDEPADDDAGADDDKEPQEKKEIQVTTKTTTKQVPVKEAKKEAKNDTKKTKDKHNTGNPILLGILAVSAAGLAVHLRRKE